MPRELETGGLVPPFDRKRLGSAYRSIARLVDRRKRFDVIFRTRVVGVCARCVI